MVYKDVKQSCDGSTVAASHRCDTEWWHKGRTNCPCAKRFYQKKASVPDDVIAHWVSRMRPHAAKIFKGTI